MSKVNGFIDIIYISRKIHKILKKDIYKRFVVWAKNDNNSGNIYHENKKKNVNWNMVNTFPSPL